VIIFSDGRVTGKLDPADLERMSATIAAAFDKHENWTRVIPDSARRTRALRHRSSFMASVINRHGHK
jgi:hypothetical protein